MSVWTDADACRQDWWCVTERRGNPGACWGTEQRQWCVWQSTAAGTGNGLCIAISGDAKNPYEVMRSYVWPWLREFLLQGKGIEVPSDLDLVSWTRQGQKGRSAHLILLPLSTLRKFRTFLWNLGKSGGKWLFPSSLLMPHHVAFSSFPGNDSSALLPPSWLPLHCRINNHHGPISWGGPRTTHTVRQDYFALSSRRHYYCGKSGVFSQSELWSVTTFALQRLTWSSAGWLAAQCLFSVCPLQSLPSTEDAGWRIHHTFVWRSPCISATHMMGSSCAYGPSWAETLELNIWKPCRVQKGGEEGSRQEKPEFPNS